MSVNGWNSKPLLNNNEDDYFYLEIDRALGLHEACCVLLKLSIAVRADEHYETLLDARRLSLTEIFQAKLGWLVGKMYSRVGTPYWVPETATESVFKQKVKHLSAGVVQWVGDEQLRHAKRQKPQGVTDRNVLRAHIDATQAPKKKEQIVAEVVRLMSEEHGLSDSDAAKLRRLLNNSEALAALVNRFQPGATDWESAARTARDALLQLERGCCV